MSYRSSFFISLLMPAVTGVLDWDSLWVEEGVSCGLVDVLSTPMAHKCWLRLNVT